MTIANHEASSVSFPGLPGIFDPQYPKLTTGWTGHPAYSGVMAEPVQTVSITSRPASDNLLAIGTRGHAGYSRKFGGVDVVIDSILTDNVNISGAYGYDLFDFEKKLAGDLIVKTTNSSVGKVATVTGIYVNSITFTFNANADCTTSWNFVADGITWSGYDVATQGAVGNSDFHCVDPLTWDEVHIFDDKNDVILTGVQSATFTFSLNRTEIFEIGQFEPYDRAVTHPYNVTVSLNTLANDVRLVNWWDKFVPEYDPMTDCNGGLTIIVRTNPISGDSTSRDFIIASGMRPTNGTLNTAVGSNSTVTLSFEGTAARF